MNLMLIECADAQLLLPRDDPRAKHVRDILHMHPGDRFDVGALNGPRGKALIQRDDTKGMALSLEWGALPRPALPISLVIGLSRPQTMRKILREAPALGVASLHIARCARSEPSYASSSLWTSTEWRDLLLLGTEQAFTTHLPSLTQYDSLGAALDALQGVPNRIALDNYEATLPMARWQAADTGTDTALCIGPERGWDGPERDLLRERSYTLAHLGPLVLRTETAMIAGTALVAAALGQWDELGA